MAALRPANRSEPHRKHHPSSRITHHASRVNHRSHPSTHPPIPPTREELLNEADAWLWRMQYKFEPWDLNKLRELYSVIPPLWDDPPVPEYKKDLTPDQLRFEAEQCLDRMQRNFQPWDHEVLRRYFSAVPSPWPPSVIES